MSTERLRPHFASIVRAMRPCVVSERCEVWPERQFAATSMQFNKGVSASESGCVQGMGWGDLSNLLSVLGCVCATVFTAKVIVFTGMSFSG